MQKQTTIEAIKNCLRCGEVEQAIGYWQDSYHPISVEEFLECNDTQSNSDLLEEISSILQSLSLAHSKISQQLEFQKPMWKKLMEAGSACSHPRQQYAHKILFIRDWIKNWAKNDFIETEQLFDALTKEAENCLKHNNKE